MERAKLLRGDRTTDILDQLNRGMPLSWLETRRAWFGFGGRDD